MAEQPPHEQNTSESARYPQSQGPQQDTNQGSTPDSGTTPSRTPKKLGPMDLEYITQQDTSQGSISHSESTSPHSSKKLGSTDILSINQQDISQESEPHPGTTPSQTPKKLGPMDLEYITQQDTSQGSISHPEPTPPHSSKKLGSTDILFINQQDTSQGSEPHPGTTPSRSSNKASLIESLRIRHNLAVVHNYDPFSVQNQHVDSQSERMASNQMTLDRLCYEGVIKKGDYLVIAITRKVDGVSHQDEAILTYTGISEAGVLKGRRLPDIAVTLCQATDFDETIVACKGTNTILDKFDELHFDVPGSTRKTIASHFRIWRGDQCLGTLKDVRLAYLAWRDNIKRRLYQMEREHESETVPAMEDRGLEKEEK